VLPQEAARAQASDAASGQFSAFGVLAVLRDACELGNQGTMSWRIPSRPVFKRPWRPLGMVLIYPWSLLRPQHELAMESLALRHQHLA